MATPEVDTGHLRTISRVAEKWTDLGLVDLNSLGLNEGELQMSGLGC